MGILSSKTKDWSAQEKNGLRKWTPEGDNEKQHVSKKAWQNEEKSGQPETSGNMNIKELESVKTAEKE